MARPNNDLKAKIDNLRPLPVYEEDRDLTPSTVEQRDALVAKALEDKTLAASLLRTFERVVDKVPSDDRISVVWGVVLVIVVAITAFVVLKVTHTW